MKRLHALRALLLLILLASAAAAGAEPTRLTVRVLAHDAKLIGDFAGGATVVVSERDTGRVLARGPHLGGTGSTEKIIVEPHERGGSIYDTEGAAHFSCELDLDQPTWVTIEATGPGSTPHAQAHASRTLLLLPGHHVDGDGIVLRLQGLIVNLLAPHPETVIAGGETVEVRVGVKLLCTCPIYEGSHWEASDYEVEAQLWSRDRMLASTPLRIGDEHNVFVGSVGIPAKDETDLGTVELRVVAANDHVHNYGVDRAFFRLRD